MSITLNPARNLMWLTFCIGWYFIYILFPIFLFAHFFNQPIIFKIWLEEPPSRCPVGGKWVSHEQAPRIIWWEGTWWKPRVPHDGIFPWSQYPGTPWSTRSMPDQSGGPTWNGMGSWELPSRPHEWGRDFAPTWENLPCQVRWNSLKIDPFQ